MRYICYVLLLQLTGCTMPSTDSEEFKFNKMVLDQRAQCRQLPEPLATSCLTDVSSKNYADYLKNKTQKPTYNNPS